MIAALRGFLRFVYDFVVGDDWQVAVGVVIALGATFLIDRVAHVPVWWIAPLAVLVLLPVSVYRAARPRRR